MASTSASSQPRTLRSTGPVLIVILIIVAALLGYYQIIYYPSANTATTSTSTQSIPMTSLNATVTIPIGANAKPTNETFLPDTITVYIGYNSTVFWVNNDTAEHTITSVGNSPDSRFDSWGPRTQPWNNIFPKGSTDGPSTLNFTFTIAGTYNYFCSYHPNMKGTVIVKQAPPGLGASKSQSSSAGGSGSSSSGILFGYLASVSADRARSLATLIGSGTAP